VIRAPGGTVVVDGGASENNIRTLKLLPAPG